MIQFWLDNLVDLFNPGNFKFGSNQSQTYIQILNIAALISIITSIVFIIKYKKPIYLGISVVVLAFTILIKSNINYSAFTSTVPGNNVNSLNVNLFDTGVYLLRATNNDPTGLNNLLYVSSILNFNKGDILALANDKGQVMETNVISDIKSTVEANTDGMNIPIIVLLNPLKHIYSKYTTKVLKVVDSSPNILPPPDPNASIQKAGTNFSSDPYTMAVQNYPKQNVNGERYDWNLENSTMVNGVPNSYHYQGQPYGNLVCREPTVQNPMGTINVTEYDSQPTMFGTCNEGNMNSNGMLNNTVMTEDQEATVSQRVDDLLFHKGNAQSRFSPVSIDTMPNDQGGFANWCYRSPTNLVNPKYASIFVNEPEKFKLVSKLAKATGTENGGGR